MLIDVSDISDPLLSDFAQLRDAQLRRSENRFIAEGKLIIERAIAAGCQPRALLLQRRWLEDLLPLLEGHPEVPIYLATAGQIETLSGFHVHRGALGSFVRPDESPWVELLQSQRLMVCEEIVDHANIGAIARVSAGLGWGGLLISPGSADPLYRRAIKASMGATLHLPWRRMLTSADLQLLRAAGFRLVAATLSERAVELSSYQPTGKLALLLGTEGNGLSEAWLAAADDHITIPMAAGVDSLNVATAAAIFGYALK